LVAAKALSYDLSAIKSWATEVEMNICLLLLFFVRRILLGEFGCLVGVFVCDEC